MKFKVLIHNNTFVDEKLLYSGLFPTLKPHLYDEEYTILDIIEDKVLYYELYPNPNAKKYFENIKYCELKMVTLSFDEI